MEKILRKLIHFFYDEICLGSYQECEGSEIFFFYFHASSLACNSFMADSSRRHGTPGSETKTLLLTVEQGALTLLSLQVLWG